MSSGQLGDTAGPPPAPPASRRRIPVVWYAVIAVLVVAGIVIGVLVGGGGGGSSTAGGLGTTFAVKADAVPLKVTLSRPDSGSGFAVRFTNTDAGRTADLLNISLVAVDPSGRWYFPVELRLGGDSSAVIVGAKLSPGRSVSGTVGFTARSVAKVLYDGDGFPRDSSGAPVRKESEAGVSWNVGG